ncbi:MAG: shikimate kinase [Betaproteobacteria bacterium]|nr:shikimate kinase [Betaproteobacteria bacterium]NBU48763.1 shikimate kinase [Betaproteobacteria bacterium]
MPGAGKTTVGRLLAKQLHLPFVDADQEIERRSGMAIKDYFATQGEPAFRELEQTVIAELANGRPMVLATGGGAVLREANREALHHHCTVVYLRSTPEELFRRLRHDRQRPLLQVDNPLRKLRELFRERDPLYRRTAHYVIETGRPTVHGLAGMILMQLELAGRVDPSRVPSPVDPGPTPAA